MIVSASFVFQYNITQAFLEVRAIALSHFRSIRSSRFRRRFMPTAVFWSALSLCVGWFLGRLAVPVAVPIIDYGSPVLTCGSHTPVLPLWITTIILVHFGFGIFAVGLYVWIWCRAGAEVVSPSCSAAPTELVALGDPLAVESRVSARRARASQP